jgi:Ca2+-binding RTX toxin-like protein
MSMVMEVLEGRRLLSAVLSTGGLLTITGTPNDDRISMVRTTKGQLVVTEKSTVKKPDGTGTLSTVETTNFSLAAVKSILVNAGEGNDSVSVAGGWKYHVVIPSRINGQNGNDSLTGGDANDTIRGGTGDDLINGGAGNDSLYGDEGADRITGDAGADLLDGGYDNDRLYADDGAGQDTLRGGGSLDGTPANDYAVVNKTDTVTKDPITGLASIKRLKTI